MIFIPSRRALLLFCVLFVSLAVSQGAHEEYSKLRGLKKDDKNNGHGGGGGQGGGGKGIECPCGKCLDFTNLPQLIETKPCKDWSTISQELRRNQWGDQTCQTNTCPNGCCRAYSWLKCDQTGQDFPYIPCICNANTQDPQNFKPVTLPPIYVPAAGQNAECPDDDEEKPKSTPNPTPSDDTGAPTPVPIPDNLVDAIIATGSYDIFLELLDKTGLDAVLKGAGSYTVLGPTDDAWPQGDDLDFFLNVMDDETKTALVSYHIIPGVLSPFDLVDGGQLTTLHGKSLDISIDHTNGVFMINGWSLIAAGIPASNGVLYEMDGFFVP